jgi:hypothetical protein
VSYRLDQGAAQPVGLSSGQRLEIHLSPTSHWTLALSDPNHVLASAPPEGWYDPTTSACVWRFVASGAGVAQLAFKGLVLCPPNVHCKAALEQAAFAVAVR